MPLKDMSDEEFLAHCHSFGDELLNNGSGQYRPEVAEARAELARRVQKAGEQPIAPHLTLGSLAKHAALAAVARHEQKLAAPNALEEEEAQKFDPATPPPVISEPDEAEVERTEPAVEHTEIEPESDLPPHIAPPASFEVPDSGDSKVEEAISPDAALRTHLETVLTDDETLTATAEFCKDQSVEASDLKEIEEGYHSWHSGSNFALITIGKEDYVVAPSEKAADKLAVEIVKSQLEGEPSLFNQDWLEGHINIERLRSELESDVEEQVRQSPDSYGWRSGDDAEGNELVRFDEEGDEDEDGKYDSSGNKIEEGEGGPSDDWVESKVQKILKNPIDYLRDIYGDETVEHVIRIAVDTNAAAEEAVAADGAGHFLSSYDGEVHDLPGGGVWWRD